MSRGLFRSGVRCVLVLSAASIVVYLFGGLLLSASLVLTTRQGDVPEGVRTAPYQALPSGRRPYDVVVVGGGVGGLSAGIYASRAGLDVLIVSDGNGELAMSELVANYPGVAPIPGTELLEHMSRQATGFGAKRHSGRVARLDTQNWPFSLSLSTPHEGSDTVDAWSVVLASGASLRWPNLKDENRFCGRFLHTCPLCDGHLYINKTVVVVGGGNSAVEAAVYMSKIARTVYLVHRRRTFRAADAVLATMHRRSNIIVKAPFSGIQWLAHRAPANAPATGSISKGNPLQPPPDLRGLLVSNVETGKTEEVPADGGFVAIGSVPVTGYAAKSEIRLTRSGHVWVNSAQGTSTQGVYAVGEVADFKYKQAVTAAASGAIAVTEAERWLQGQTVFAEHKKAYPSRPRPEVPAVPTPVGTQAAQEDPAQEIECKEVALACLKKFVTKHQVVVFSVSYCPDCIRAKQLLASLDIDDVKVVELDMSMRGREVRSVLKQFTGRRTVPNIFVRGRNIGGSEELEAEKDVLELLLRKKGQKVGPQHEPPQVPSVSP